MLHLAPPRFADRTEAGRLLATRVKSLGLRDPVVYALPRGGVVVARMMESAGNHGFDAAHKQYVDLVEAGIIDPTKVVRVALENAVSVASVLLLTEATMTELPEPARPRAEQAEMPL